MISKHIIKKAISDISDIPNIEMDAHHLTLDVFALSQLFDDEEKFSNVISSIIAAIFNLKTQPNIGEDLFYDLKEFKSYHFNSPYPKFANEEDMRIVYHFLGSLKILGFGHRYIPSDFYEKIKVRANK